MSLDGVQAHLVDDIDTAMELKRWLSERREVGFDTEGTGLDPTRDRVRLVQYGDAQTGWAIPFERWGGLVDELVRRYDGTYKMHNAPYDQAMMAHEGIVIPQRKIRDTRLQLHVLSSTDSLALKPAACKYVDPRADVGKNQLEDAMAASGWTWATVPYNFEPYWVYGALDPILTYQLDEKLWPQIQATAPKSYNLEMEVAWICYKMQQRGVLVDREYTEAFIDELNVFIERARDWCKSNYNLNPGSDVKVAEALLADNVPLTKRTASGRYSVDKYVLEAFGTHPLAQTVLNYRRANKTVGTYLQNYLDMSERDGFIHPSINTVGGTGKNMFESGGSGRGVRTGRMSMSDPNLQNVPTRTKMGARVRNCFPARPGHAWVKCDFEQIEMRGLAHESNDPHMIDAFTSEGDFFVNMAKRIFNDPDFQKSDPRRQQVKNSGYAKIYGAGAEKFAITAGMFLLDGSPDIAGAASFLNTFDNLFPGVRRFQDEVATLGQRRKETEGEAYVRSSITGRKHVADRGREYTLVNYQIQGEAGEILKMKIIEADQAGLTDYMLFPVHDDVNADVPREELDDYVRELQKVMNDDDLLRVPIRAAVAVGPRWGEAKDI